MGLPIYPRPRELSTAGRFHRRRFREWCHRRECPQVFVVGGLGQSFRQAAGREIRKIRGAAIERDSRGASEQFRLAATAERGVGPVLLQENLQDFRRLLFEPGAEQQIEKVESGSDRGPSRPVGIGSMRFRVCCKIS